MVLSACYKEHSILHHHVIEITPSAHNCATKVAKDFEQNKKPNSKETKEVGEQIVIFSPAAGLACETYLDLLQKWSDIWGVRIFTYDPRGIGKTQLPHPFRTDYKPSSTVAAHRSWHLKLTGDEVTPVLLNDFCQVFFAIRNREVKRCQASKVPPPEFVFAGHSYGGWLSLLGAHKCHVAKIVLLDIALLPLQTAALWTLACLFRQRQWHTLASQVKLRKMRYHNSAEATRIFKRFPFFKGWSPLQLELFVKANYVKENDELVLRHDPFWEASILESQQPSALLAFLSIPKWLRLSSRLSLIVGENSEACSHQAKALFLANFPAANWYVLPAAGHMYPFSKDRSLLALLQEIGPDYVTGRSSAPQEVREPTKNIHSANNSSFNEQQKQAG